MRGEKRQTKNQKEHLKKGAKNADLGRLEYRPLTIRKVGG